MSTEFFLGQTDGGHKVIKPLVLQGGELQSLLYARDHIMVFLRIRAGIFR